jgi:hypothetical protein
MRLEIIPMFRFLFVMATATMFNLAAADLSGKWTGTMETDGSRVRIFITLNLFQPGTGGQQHAPIVSGTVATGDETKPVPIEKAEIQGDTVTFEVHDNAGRIVKFHLSLLNRVLEGEARAGEQISRIALSPAVLGGVFKVGGGVSAPVVIHKVDPEYTEEARAAKFQGTVLLSVQIDPNGNPTNIRVVRSLWIGS